MSDKSLLNRWLKRGKDAGLVIESQGEGWDVITKSNLKLHCASDSELISYLQGYLAN